MKEQVIIVDLDGTLADSRDRSHHLNKSDGTKDWDSWYDDTYTDKPISSVKHLCMAMHAYKIQVIFLTARSEDCRSETEKWLEDNIPLLAFNQLFMRQSGDYRPDHIVKKEIFVRDIDPVYETIFAIDDKEEVAQMFESMGVHVLRVNGFGKGDAPRW